MDDDAAYCIEGCGRPAVAERLTGVAAVPWDGDDFTPVVELVCYEHARDRP